MRWRAAGAQFALALSLAHHNDFAGHVLVAFCPCFSVFVGMLILHMARTALYPTRRAPAAEESQQEMAQLQAALIASEERRLQVGRALLATKLEHTDALQAGETAHYELQQKIIDLEGRLAQGLITTVRAPCFSCRESRLRGWGCAHPSAPAL